MGLAAALVAIRLARSMLVPSDTAGRFSSTVVAVALRRSLQSRFSCLRYGVSATTLFQVKSHKISLRQAAVRIPVNSFESAFWVADTFDLKADGWIRYVELLLLEI